MNKFDLFQIISLQQFSSDVDHHRSQTKLISTNEYLIFENKNKHSLQIKSRF